MMNETKGNIMTNSKQILETLISKYNTQKTISTLNELRTERGLMEELMMSFQNLHYTFSDELDFVSAKSCLEWYDVCNQFYEALALIERLHTEDNHPIDWLERRVSIQHYTTLDGHQTWCAVL
jgi:hypothetical protein